MKVLMKKIWEFVKIKTWYIILLGLSSAYVWYYRLEIYQLKELNAQNLIFIIWLILLLLPLFSELEFLGLKIKKEVQKETEEVKTALNSIQSQVNQLQLTSSVANNFSFYNSSLPTKQKLDELNKEIAESGEISTGVDITKEAILDKDEDKAVYLFKVRLNIEKCVHEICEKIGEDIGTSQRRGAFYLKNAGIIDNITFDLIRQVCSIANHGIHGEIVSDEYIEFVKRTYPEIMRRLKETTTRLDE